MVSPFGGLPRSFSTNEYSITTERFSPSKTPLFCRVAGKGRRFGAALPLRAKPKDGHKKRGQTAKTGPLFNTNSSI
ncbi:hypothetical protein HMPREF0262_00373 [Clostridium sp. ATCC 29733]|nr:hypothetical protein HMPREF0262_00373 [Clostridium sp. ATCC 29733]